MIEQQNLLIEFLVKQYQEDELQKSLAFISTKIRDILDEFIKTHAKNLIQTHPIKGHIKKYDIIYRVKEFESLKEKFYRSNLLSKRKYFSEDFLDKLLRDENEYRKDPEVLSKIDHVYETMGDTIGVRILTDLNSEVEYLFQNIKSQSKILSDKYITIDQCSLTRQPETMVNGLKIYKMDCTYKSRYHFELQLKSRISAAWGDMEHSAFYKEHSISPVRSITKDAMTHVGHLLHQIEEMLEAILSAEPNYKDNAEVYKFLDIFSRTYSTPISKILNGINFNTQNIEDILFYLYSLIKNQLKNKMPPISNHLVNKTHESSKFPHYCKTRDCNYDLIIFESIVAGWYIGITKIDNLDDKYNVFLQWFFDKAKDSIIKRYNDYYCIEEVEKTKCKTMITKYFDFCTLFSTDFKYIFQISKYKILYDLITAYNDINEVNNEKLSEEKISYDKYVEILIISDLKQPLQKYSIEQIETSESFLSNMDITKYSRDVIQCKNEIIGFMKSERRRLKPNDSEEDINQDLLSKDDISLLEDNSEA